jgi:hypothetical protein
MSDLVDREAVRMELYADLVRVTVHEPWLCLRAYRGDTEYQWTVATVNLWGLSNLARVNYCVDAFRVEYGSLGV